MRLEPAAHVHLADLAEVAAERSNWTYWPGPVLSEGDELRRWIERGQREMSTGIAVSFALIDRARSKAVGMTALFEYSEQDRRVEIGRTWLGLPARRTAVNTEAKLLLLTHGFEALDLVRVQIKTDARNVVSQRAIERLGARREGVWRKHVRMRDGFQRDTVMYSVIAPEWPAVKAGLEARLARG